MAASPRLSLQSPIVEVVVSAGASMGRSAAAMAPFVARLRADWIDTCGDLLDLSKDRDAWAALDIPAKLKLKLKQLAAGAGPGTESQGTPRSRLNPCADEERNPSPTRGGSSHGAMPLSPGVSAATALGTAPSAVPARSERKDATDTADAPANGSWIPATDPATGSTYYYHSVTGESTWQLPTQYPTLRSEDRCDALHHGGGDGYDLHGSHGTAVATDALASGTDFLRASFGGQASIQATSGSGVVSGRTSPIRASARASAPSSVPPRGGRGSAPSGAPQTPHKWECHSCTYLNHARTERCAICSTAKPVLEAGTRPATELVERGVGEDDFLKAAFRFVRHTRNGDLVALLDNKVVQPHVVDEHGNTLLMVAAQNDNVAAAKILIKRGVDINARNHKGRTAFAMAVRFGFQRVAEVLLVNGAVDDDVPRREAAATTRMTPSAPPKSAWQEGGMVDAPPPSPLSALTPAPALRPRQWDDGRGAVHQSRNVHGPMTTSDGAATAQWPSASGGRWNPHSPSPLPSPHDPTNSSRTVGRGAFGAGARMLPLYTRGQASFFDDDDDGTGPETPPPTGPWHAR